MKIYRLRGGAAQASPAGARGRVILLSEMPTSTETDELCLARAIELARNGAATVKPNPVVGAVIARDGEILGEGWHKEFGGAHAEVNAIEACGMTELAGATLYVSLEPCCHEGKTPPCTDAILQSGIRRVVVGSDDPTEKASGRGLGILRDEGVEVVLADRRARGERAAAQPGVSQARAGRAPVGAVQVGDDARRQGRDAHAATRSGSAASRAASWPTAGAPRSTRSSSASAPRWPTIRS